MPQTFDMARICCADLIGVRIVTMYTDDIYRIAGLLKKSPGIKLLYQKDFIRRPKKSGYRSLHLIVTVNVFHNGMNVEEKCEIQIRTMEMDSWAELEHQLIYKNANRNRAIEAELRQWAQELAEQDRKLIELRKRIMTPPKKLQKEGKENKNQEVSGCGSLEPLFCIKLQGCSRGTLLIKVDGSSGHKRRVDVTY